MKTASESVGRLTKSGNVRARAGVEPPVPTPEELLDDCMRLVAKHVKWVGELDDDERGREMHLLAKLMPVLQAAILFRIDPFGEIGERRRKLLSATRAIEGADEERERVG